MILALDCASKTGWAILSDGKILESGTEDFTKSRGESNGMMFIKFRVWLKKVLGAFPISLVVYEQSHHRGGAATEICVNLTGRVQELCSEHNIEYTTCHSGTLKKFATGSGTASKEDMIEIAEKLIGGTGALHLMDDNEADAINMAFWAYDNYKS
jgi:Holliday junction resolvasome RuvABC endonuclease subunit